ncbi:MAG: hypothetical protein R2911_00040 [Caldilineaceae bacterium]
MTKRRLYSINTSSLLRSAKLGLALLTLKREMRVRSSSTHGLLVV